MSEQAPELEATGEDTTALGEELLDSLRLLNYEKDYVQKGGKPVTSASFSYQSNPTEQFTNFKNLVKYLLQVNEAGASNFSQYDDPITVSTNIINECKKMQVPCDFPPLKLKSGCGDQVLTILTSLATKALRKKGFSYKRPKYEDPAAPEQAEPEDQKEAHETSEIIDDPDLPDDLDLDQEQVGVAALDEDKQIIHSAVNEKDWQLECERVANRLKVQQKGDTKEWRAHIDTTKTCIDSVKKNFPNARAVLEKVNDDIGRTLQKIQKSERVINSNMSDVGQQYKSQSEQLKKLSTHYNNMSAALKEMNDNYRVVSQKLEQIQAKTNEHSGSMTDNSPVVKIKESLIKIMAEIKSMDVRMGVLSHTILQYKTKEKAGDRKAYKNIDAEDLYDFE